MFCIIFGRVPYAWLKKLTAGNLVRICFKWLFLIQFQKFHFLSKTFFKVNWPLYWTSYKLFKVSKIAKKANLSVLTIENQCFWGCHRTKVSFSHPLTKFQRILFHIMYFELQSETLFVTININSLSSSLFLLIFWGHFQDV